MRIVFTSLVAVAVFGCRSSVPSEANRASSISESAAADPTSQPSPQAVRDAQEIYRNLEPADASTPALLVSGDRAKRVSGVYNENDLQTILKLIGRVRYVYASKRVSLVVFSGNSVTVKTAHNLYKLSKNQTGEWRIIAAYWWEL